MGLICSYCGCDIDALGQCNMSCTLDYNLCEDCWRERKKDEKRRDPVCKFNPNGIYQKKTQTRITDTDTASSQREIPEDDADE